MEFWSIAVFLSVVGLVAGICDDPALGLTLRACQPCGSPGLDDFCIKRQGRCGAYSISSGMSAYGDLGGANGLPPFGYLSNASPEPTTCTTIKAAAQSIPNRAGTAATIPVYTYASNWGDSLPRVAITPIITQFLRINPFVHDCLENNAPFPNGRWNWRNPYDGRQGRRLDSFFYEDKGNSTWSYQCYCDFCNTCQTCTNG